MLLIQAISGCMIGQQSISGPHNRVVTSQWSRYAATGASCHRHDLVLNMKEACARPSPAQPSPAQPSLCPYLCHKIRIEINEGRHHLPPRRGIPVMLLLLVASPRHLTVDILTTVDIL